METDRRFLLLKFITTNIPKVTRDYCYNKCQKLGKQPIRVQYTQYIGYLQSIQVISAYYMGMQAQFT